MEKITLSKVERFALAAAQGQLAQAQVAFNELINDVVSSHGIDEKDAGNWAFSRDFSNLMRVKKVVPDKPEPDKKTDAPADPPVPPAAEGDTPKK